MSCIMSILIHLPSCSTHSSLNFKNSNLPQDKSVGTNPNLNNKNSSNIKQDNYYIKEALRGKLLEKKIYSPDKKNYIKVVTNGETDLTDSVYSFDLFLNSNSKPLDNREYSNIESNISSKEAIWLNNENVIILGNYIYNINTAEKINILEPSIKDDNTTIINYAINNDLSKLAYITLENYQLRVYINDLKTNTWTKLYSEEIIITEDIFYNIVWSNNNIYFNSADVNSDNSISYKIMKYDINKGKISDFLNNSFLLNKSFDSNYLTILNSKSNTTEILNLVENNSLSIEYSYQLCWLETKDIFIYYIKDYPSVIKVMNPVDKTQYDINIPKYEDGYKMQNFRVESDKFMFDAVKYNTNADGYNFIDQVITYVLEIEKVQ